MLSICKYSNTLALWAVFGVPTWHATASQPLPSSSATREIEQQSGIEFQYFPQTNTAMPRRSFLLIHGLRSSLDTWTDTAHQLQPFGSVWAINLPGYGKSRLPSPFDADIVTKKLETFVLAKNLTAFGIIAHSMGAKTSVLFAPKVISRVRFLVIEDMEMVPRAYNVGKVQTLVMEQLNQGVSSLKKAKDAFQFLGYSIDKFFTYLENRSIELTTTGLYRSKLPLVDDLYHRHVTARTVIAHDFKVLVASTTTTIPMLLVRATNDSSVSDEGAAWMQQMHPTMSTMTVPSSTHNVHKSNPDEFIKLVTSFLQKTWL